MQRSSQAYGNAGKNRLGKTWLAAIRTDIQAVLRSLARRIAKIEAAVGRVTSATLLVTMPELGGTVKKGGYGAMS